MATTAVVGSLTLHTYDFEALELAHSLFFDLKRIRVEREEGVVYKGQAIRVEWGSLVLEELHKSSHKFSAEFFFSSLLVFVFYFLNVVLHSYGLYFDKHV